MQSLGTRRLAQCSEAGEKGPSGIRESACFGLSRLQNCFLRQRLLDSLVTEPTLCSLPQSQPKDFGRANEGLEMSAAHRCPPDPDQKRDGRSSRSGLWMSRLQLGSPWHFPSCRCRFPGLHLLHTTTCHPHSPPAGALLPTSLQEDRDQEQCFRFPPAAPCCRGHLTAAFLSYLGAFAENIWLFLQEFPICLNLKQSVVTRIWTKRVQMPADPCLQERKHLHAAPIRCQKKPAGVARKKEVVGRAVQPGGLVNLGESKLGLTQPAWPSRESQECFQVTEHPRPTPTPQRSHSLC